MKLATKFGQCPYCEKHTQLKRIKVFFKNGYQCTQCEHWWIVT